MKRGQATIAMKATALPPQKSTVLERLGAAGGGMARSGSIEAAGTGGEKGPPTGGGGHGEADYEIVSD